MKRAATLFTILGLALAAPAAMASDVCDYDGDGAVGDGDREAILAASAVTATEGDPEWNAAMDHDGDGAISLRDVSKFLEVCN